MFNLFIFSEFNKKKPINLLNYIIIGILYTTNNFRKKLKNILIHTCV